jgi:hypothetical protein
VLNLKKNRNRRMNNRPLIVIALNILTIGILLWSLTENLSVINQLDFQANEHAEVLIKAGLLKQVGIDVNLITGITVGLLVLNLLLFRLWVKSKRWILIPCLIFILSLGLSFTYYFNMTKTIGEEIEKNKKLSTTKPIRKAGYGYKLKV